MVQNDHERLHFSQSQHLELNNRLTAIRERIAKTAESAGRNPEDIRLIAVTKTASPVLAEHLLTLGIQDMAENRWQVAREKLVHPFAARVRWHFIGPLQSNKIKSIASAFSVVHALEDAEHAEQFEQILTSLGKHMEAFVQVNVSGEPQKHGVHPENLHLLLQKLQNYKFLRVVGLMTMAPLTRDSIEIRRTFRGLANLLGEERERLSWGNLQYLSMGMSNDYELAISEGATHLRIGRQLVSLEDTPEGGESR